MLVPEQLRKGRIPRMTVNFAKVPIYLYLLVSIINLDAYMEDT